jgi:hypothetical protein
MNASDILKAKQAKTLYRAYYKPTVFQSTTYSTLNNVSSIFVSPSESGNIVANQYKSCINTVYNYVAEPTYLTYELAQQVKDGAYGCGGKVRSQMQWKATNSTIIYCYSSIYSSFNTPNISTVSSVNIQSTIVNIAPGPMIQPLINYYQPTTFSACKSCDNIYQVTNGCCPNCNPNL